MVTTQHIAYIELQPAFLFTHYFAGTQWLLITKAIG